VPSQILYTGLGPLDYKCGYEIPDGYEPLKWFKLLLPESADLPDYIKESVEFDKIEEARKALRQAGKTVEDVVADYLTFLWSHVISIIKRSKTQSVFNTTPFQVVLTVPAIWQANATQKMEDAAAKAGILDFRRPGLDTTLHTVPEPEAAALATYVDLGPCGMFQEGQTFVVLDAGGGTCVSQINKAWIYGD
jgi:molecular chaperone DnaK (HSP70)